MNTPEKQIEKWTVDYLEAVDQLEELLSHDFDHMQYSREFSNPTVITERPDHIPQKAWDRLFIKSRHNFKKLKGQSFDYVEFLEIEDIKIGFIDSYPYVMVAFEDDISDSHTSSNTISSNMNTLRRHDGIVRMSNLHTEAIQKFLKVAMETYGDDRVLLTIPRYDPEFTFDNLGYSNRPHVLVHHEDFWCYDKYGIGMKIEHGMTSFNFNSSGVFASNIGTKISFFTPYRDVLRRDVGITQPHVSPSNSYRKINMKSVCLGTGSPVKYAISSYVDNPYDEDMIFNVFINYNNLLRSEDDEGVPHIRMRNSLIKTPRSSAVQRMSYEELEEVFNSGELRYTVDIVERGLHFEIDESSISEYVGRDEGQGNIYYNEQQDKFFLREIKDYRGSRTATGRLRDIQFNDHTIPAELTEVSEDKYDLSGMDNEDLHWKETGQRMPRSSTIGNFNRKMNSIINAKLISEQDVNKISVEIEEEELIGLARVRRNSNVEDILEAAGSNQLAS